MVLVYLQICVLLLLFCCSEKMVNLQAYANLFKRNEVNIDVINDGNVIRIINSLRLKNNKPLSIHYKIGALNYLKEIFASLFDGGRNLTATGKDFKERRPYRNNALDSALFNNLIKLYTTLVKLEPLAIHSRSKIDICTAILLWGFTDIDPKLFAKFTHEHYKTLISSGEVVVQHKNRNVKIAVLNDYLKGIADPTIEKFYNYRNTTMPAALTLPESNETNALKIREYNPQLLVSCSPSTLNRDMRELFLQISKTKAPTSFGFQKWNRVNKAVFMEAVIQYISKAQLNEFDEEIDRAVSNLEDEQRGKDLPADFALFDEFGNEFTI